MLPGATEHPRTVVVLLCPQRVDLPRRSRGSDLSGDCRQSGHLAVAQDVAWGLELCKKSPDPGHSVHLHRSTGLRKLQEGSLAGTLRVLAPQCGPALSPSPPLLKNARTHRMRAASQTGGVQTCSRSPWRGSSVVPRPHRRLTGRHVPLSHCAGWRAAAAHTGWALPALLALSAHTARASRVEAPPGGGRPTAGPPVPATAWVPPRSHSRCLCASQGHRRARAQGASGVEGRGPWPP